MGVDVVPMWVWCGGAALLVSAVAVPIARHLAIRAEWYDRPDAGLKTHSRPIPFSGGVGIYAGWLAAMGVAIWMGAIGWREGAAIIAGGTVMAATGLADDIRHLSPGLRLAIQAAVAIGLVMVGGIGRGIWASLFGGVQDAGAMGDGWMASGGAAGLAAAGVFCVAALSGATNATNLIDGLDGLCAGVSAVAAGGFGALLALLAGNGEGGSTGGWMCICAAVMGSCAGFLIYNFNPASVFMGDNGSLLLGYNAALLIVGASEAGGWRGLAGALLVFGFPIFDAGLAITRRRLNGRPLFRGDRSHFYDQVRDRGLSVRGTVGLCYLFAAGFGVIGAGVSRMPGAAAVGVCIVVPMGLAIVCLRAGLLRVDDSAARSERRG